MTRIAVLLNGSIANDSGVIKTVKTLSSINGVFIDLFYIDPMSNDELIFNENVTLYPKKLEVDYKILFWRHTFFVTEFLFFVEVVLKTNKKYDFIYANDLPCLKPALRIKEKIGAKVIYDAHEIYNETINQFFPKKAIFLKRIIFFCLISFMKFFGSRQERKMGIGWMILLQ
jgi:hypothetical protein